MTPCSKNQVTCFQGINFGVQHGQKLQSQNKVVKQECMDVGLPHRGRYINQPESTGAVAQGLRATDEPCAAMPLYEHAVLAPVSEE